MGTNAIIKMLSHNVISFDLFWDYPCLVDDTKSGFLIVSVRALLETFKTPLHILVYYFIKSIYSFEL